MSFVANQLSFDDPMPVDVPSPRAADPLVEAIYLHEQAKATVQQLSAEYNRADIEMIRIKRLRDEAKRKLLDLQLEMDYVSRQRHDLQKPRDAALETMNSISAALVSMGAKPWGNNTYVTPAQLEEWQRTGKSPFND